MRGAASRVGVVRAGSTANEGGGRPSGLSRSEGTNTEVALRFARARVHDGSRETAAEHWTGQVEATFYGDPIHRIPPGSSPSPYSRARDEAAAATSSPSPQSRDETADESSSTSAYSYETEDEDATVPIPSVIVSAPVPTQPRAPAVTYAAPKNKFYLNPSLASSDVGYVPGKSAKSQMKGVKSAEGRTALRTLNLNWSEKKKPDKPKKQISRKPSNATPLGGPVVKEPEVLGTLILRYSSTVGLIHAGILVKPPNWGVELLRKACSKRTLKENAKILAKIKVRKIELMHETVNGHGKVVNKREMEVLDLTEGGDEW